MTAIFFRDALHLGAQGEQLRLRKPHGFLDEAALTLVIFISPIRPSQMATSSSVPRSTARSAPNLIVVPERP